MLGRVFVATHNAVNSITVFDRQTGMKTTTGGSGEASLFLGQSMSIARLPVAGLNQGRLYVDGNENGMLVIDVATGKLTRLLERGDPALLRGTLDEKGGLIVSGYSDVSLYQPLSRDSPGPTRWGTAFV